MSCNIAFGQSEMGSVKKDARNVNEKMVKGLIAKKVLIRERGLAVVHTNVTRATCSLQWYRQTTLACDVKSVYCVIVI
jgi:hypothetical protein